MSYSLRLARLSCINTWLGLVTSVLAFVLMQQFGAPPGVHLHALAF